ncbi:MAG TPA: MFS transporter [Bacteroidales bacterium]|jgi:POT family proton-dependent oligopeptide transporter|nr:MFS transporter [Bacteroidales bacterium]HQH23453.1 MFS transporter [Bacteroidales bacterium]HQJ82029.1 MFS transporter [Bacteroidales bacterium]
MLKNHPRGLLVAFFSNMGERFGFYTMMAILVLFLQAKYDLPAKAAGDIYSWFYFAIYALALIGGVLADSTKKYKLVILAGIIVMFIGYFVMAIPGMTLTVTLIGLGTIALGNGLFKGNLQAVVGQMYDDPRYSKLRDTAFMIFYMGINIGAFFAPHAADGMRNWWLKTNGFLHDGSLPSLCHQFNKGTLTDITVFQQLADKVSLSGPVSDLSAFANNYLEVFSRGYNYAFAVAAGAMIISLLVYVIFNRLLPSKDKVVSAVRAEEKNIKTAEKIEFEALPIAAAIAAIGVTAFLLQLLNQIDVATGLAFGVFAGFVTWIILSSRKEERARVTALVLVFFVAIFFWMSFHQNGLTLTLFARDYTVKQVGPFTGLFFTLPSILAFIAVIAGIVMLFYKKQPRNFRITGAVLLAAGLWFVVFFLTGFDPTTLLGRFLSPFGPQNAISPEIFQQFNPLFIVALTFPVLAFFSWLNKKGIEPSTPKKIGIGLLIASVGFLIVLIGSIGAPSPASLGGSPVADADRVSPYWLINSYLILTVAELFLSPMGLSFVSKVAPSRFQGLMQGGWLLATAAGNKLLFVGTLLWDKIQLSTLWLIFIVCLLLSAGFIFSILKRLEKASGS